MTVTYHHDHEHPEHNPGPLTHDALTAAAGALEFAARGYGPVARASDASTPRTARAGSESGITIIPVMGAKLSPSPELHGHGCAVLEIDYADGSTRTFDVDAQGNIEPRRYAYAFAVVIESDHELTEQERGDVIDGPLIPANAEYASTPVPIPLNTGEYDVQPRDETEGGRNR